jgi:FMN phosphatase YigB (HAD superfamily)
VLSRIWATHRDVPVDGHITAILDAVETGLSARVSADVTAALIEAYSRPALLVPPTVDDGAVGALETLCARGYTLAVVSNTMRTPGATLRKLLEKFRLLACFKHTTFSDEIGVRKPDPAIFIRTLQSIGADPQKTVHVGDDSVLDIEGARAAGIRGTVQVTSAPLRALGVHGPDAVVPSLARLPDVIAEFEK